MLSTDNAINFGVLLRALADAAPAEADRAVLVHALREQVAPADGAADAEIFSRIGWDLFPWLLDGLGAAPTTAAELNADLLALVGGVTAHANPREIFVVVLERLQTWSPDDDRVDGIQARVLLQTLAGMLLRLKASRRERFLSSLALGLRPFWAAVDTLLTMEWPAATEPDPPGGGPPAPAARSRRSRRKRRGPRTSAPLEAATPAERAEFAAAALELLAVLADAIVQFAAVADDAPPLAWAAWPAIRPADHPRALAAVALLDGLGALARHLAFSASALLSSVRLPIRRGPPQPPNRDHPPAAAAPAEPAVDTWLADRDDNRTHRLLSGILVRASACSRRTRNPCSCQRRQSVPDARDCAAAYVESPAGGRMESALVSGTRYGVRPGPTVPVTWPLTSWASICVLRATEANRRAEHTDQAAPDDDDQRLPTVEEHLLKKADGDVDRPGPEDVSDWPAPTVPSIATWLCLCRHPAYVCDPPCWEAWRARCQRGVFCPG